MTSWTSGCLFNYHAASLHDDLCYFLILVVVFDQSLMPQCSISALGWWLFTFLYPYPLGKPLLYIADHRDIFTERSNLVSYLLFNKQHYQRCHKDITRALWLWNPQTLRSASFPFSPLLMMSQGGFPFPPPHLSWWPSSIAALKRALLSNHCCPAESLLCPQSHLYVLLLNYPG